MLTLFLVAWAWFKPSISFYWLFDSVVFAVPMLLAILFTLGILDDR
jgi:hypothetical protein